MRTAVSNFLFVSALGIPLLAIYFISPGPFAGRLLPAAMLLMAVGVLSSLVFFVMGKKADREYGDERANLILEKSAKFTFYVMAVVIQVYWAYNFSINGNDGDYPFYLLVFFWGSLLVSLIYNSKKL